MTFNATNTNYADLILIEGGASDNIIENCIFNGQLGIGSLVLQSGVGDHPNHIFRNNTFNSGDVAIYFDYISGGANSNGLEIVDNTFRCCFDFCS